MIRIILGILLLLALFVIISEYKTINKSEKLKEQKKKEKLEAIKNEIEDVNLDVEQMCYKEELKKHRAALKEREDKLLGESEND